VTYCGALGVALGVGLLHWDLEFHIFLQKNDRYGSMAHLSKSKISKNEKDNVPRL
jgi:hypothetical protein